MKSFSLLFFLLLSFQLSAQVDSLLMCLDTARTEDVRHQILDQICSTYHDANEYDSLKFYTALYISELGNTQLDKQRDSYVRLADCAVAVKPSELHDIAEKFELLSDQSYDNLYILSRLYFLSYLKSGDILSAYKHLQKAMNYARLDTGSNKRLLLIHGDYFTIYSEYLNDYENALKHAKEGMKISLELYNEQKDKASVISNYFASLNGMGVAYKNVEKLDSALLFYQKSLDFTLEHSYLSHPFYEAVNKSNISEVLLLQGAVEDAYSLAREAVEAADKVGIVNVQSVCLLNLGESQYLQNALEEASNSMLKIVVDVLSASDKARFYKLQANIEEARLNSKSALIYQKKYNSIRDSFQKSYIKNSLIRQEVAYEFELERRELEYQQSLKENQLKQQRLGLGLLGILFILSGILAATIYRSYRQQRATNKILIETQTSLQKSNHRLNRFARSISHDIMGQLEHILLSSKLVDEAQFLSTKGKTYYTESINSARSLRDYCYELLIWSKQDSSLTEQEEISLENIVEEVLRMFKQQLEEDNFDIQIGALPSIRMPKAVLQQVIHNLVSNAIKNTKYRDKPLLKIEGVQEEQDWVIAVEDNGKGVPIEERLSIFKSTANPEEKHGRGLSYVKDILQEYEESIWVDNNQLGGASFYFTVR